MPNNSDSVVFLSPTATYRLMNGLEGAYPADAELCKAAALLYDTVYVNVQKGPLSDFLGAFADQEQTRLRNSVSCVFRPLSGLSPAPNPSTIRLAIEKGENDADFLVKHARSLDRSVFANTPFRNREDPIGGELNPLLSIEIMMLFGLTEFDTIDRAKRLQKGLGAWSAKSAEDSVNVAVPDYSRLSWEDIIEIRAQSSWRDFQQLLNSSVDPKELADRINKAWVTLGVAFLEGQESALYRAVSHIPMGPVPVPNPLGVMRDVKAWREQRALNAEFPWIHTIALAQNKLS